MMIQSKKTLKDKLGTPEDIEKKANKKSDGLKQTKLNFKKRSPNQGWCSFKFILLYFASS